MKVAVVGVPKTIDNDILLMDKTFGFDTAVEEAQRAINSAYIEVYIETTFGLDCMSMKPSALLEIGFVLGFLSWSFDTTLTQSFLIFGLQLSSRDKTEFKYLTMKT